MHTVMVLVGGFLLLGQFLIVSWLMGGSSAVALGHAALYFVPAWAVATLVNMYVGVTRAGYSIADETPVLLLVFSVPAVVALVLWWWLAK